MFIDAQQLFSDAQALTASAASSNYIDLGSDRNIGVGEPMAVVINVDVVLGGTSTPSFSFAIEMDDNTSFSSAIKVATSQVFTVLPAGKIIVVPVPKDLTGEQYMRMYYTAAGTNPTLTVTASLIPQSMVQADAVYPKGYTIS